MRSERRNSDRISTINLWVKESNGDYLFSFQALDLSEEGIFLVHKRCTSDQSDHSHLTFTLPGGKQLRNLIARIVRQEKHGAAYEFLNLSEATRLELKRFIVASALRGTA